MFGLDIISENLFDQTWQGTLSDYVTAIAWSPDGKTLAASSAAGEVVLLQTSETLTVLQTANERSVDCLAFSQDGQFLAVCGQNGLVKIWRLQSGENQLITTLENAPNWVDRLAWSPISNQLAFSMGKYVQVWDASAKEVVATLNFEASSVMSMAWSPNGENLAISGHKGLKVWNAQDWDEDPTVLEIPVASLAIAFSKDSKYIASGNLDNSQVVWEWNNPYPWAMRGFPGKIHALAWSEPFTNVGAPLLAVASGQSVVVWEMNADESVGWQGRLLNIHEGVVQAIAFQPKTFLLASAAEDGYVCLWQNAQEIAQPLDGAESFSCLAWQPQANKLAAGGQNGELLIWAKVSRGQGFAPDDRKGDR